MKKLLILFFFGLLLVSCSGIVKTPSSEDLNVITEGHTESVTIEVQDTLPPYEITKKKSGNYNLWTIKENKNKVKELRGEYYYEICPKGIFDKPISNSKKQALKNTPVTYKDATWSAALRALTNLQPQKDSKIIFDYSKFNRQINNEYECLFFGRCEIKNEKGEYVEAEASILVKYIFVEDMRKPYAWYCVGNIVF